MQNNKNVKRRLTLLLYIPQFGLTPDKTGLVFLAGAIPYALFAPIAGALADKIVSHNIIV